MKRSFILFILGIFLFSCSQESSDQPEKGAKGEKGSAVTGKVHVMKLGLITPLKDRESLDFGSAQNWFFKDKLEELSKGRIKVELHGASALGGPRSLLVQTKKGTVQGCDAEGAYLSFFLPQAQILSLPYIFPSEEVAWRVLSLDSQFMKDFNKFFIKKTGMRIISMGENGGGFRHLSNNKREIRTPADLKGLKMRVMRLPIHIEWMKALGASPTPISWTELYTALQTGVVDGQENPISTFKFGGFTEVQKYMTLDAHVFGIYCLIINNNWYRSLPKDLQKAVTHCGNLTTKVNIGISQHMQIQDLAYIKSKGVQVYVPTQEEKDMFKKLSRDKVLKLAKKQLGDKWVNKILRAIDKAKKEVNI